MWPLFAFATAFLETAKDVVGKQGAQKTNEYMTAFAMQFFEAILLSGVLLVVGIPVIQPMFWVVLLGFCITIPSASILYMRAIKLSPLSISIPMLAFNPIITALLAVFFDHKFPSPLGWTGIGLVCIGLYCIRLTKDVIKKGLWYPLFRIIDEPGTVAMLGVSFIWSVGAHLSTAAVRTSSPLFAVWAGAVAGATILFVIMQKYGGSFLLFKKNAGRLISLGVIDGLSNLAMYTALSTGLTVYVVSIKRTNMLWSSLMGKILFGESVGKIKIIGLLMMLLGIGAILAR
ncbi:MAG: DMT family transporter [Patescibacteria group bacterium]